MKRKSIFFIFLIVFILGVAKIFLTAKLATTGVDLAKIEKETTQLTDQNLFIEEKASEFSSLTRVASEAGKLGFLPVERMVSLSLKLPIAFHESH